MADKVYIVNQLGGLGNQIFCYIFYKKLCHDYPDKKFLMDISGVYDKYYERNAEFLHLFPNIEIDLAKDSQVRKIEHRIKVKYKGKGHRFAIYFADFLNNKLFHAPEGSCVTDEQFRCWGNMIPEGYWGRIGFFDGFWQDMDFYRDIWDEVTSDLIYRDIDDTENAKVLDEIENSNSVSVHIRRGDYVGESRFDILDKAYYSNIIKQVQNENHDARFFFFSNDPGYVAREYDWVSNRVVVDINYGKNSYKDMQLMSACKTNIVANSTFSIWASFLNHNSDRKVYYPSYYFRDEMPLDYSFLDGFFKVPVYF